MNGGIGGRDSTSVINMIHKQIYTKCLVMLVNIYYGRSIGSPYIQFIAGVQFPFVESLFWPTNTKCTFCVYIYSYVKLQHINS